MEPEESLRHRVIPIQPKLVVNHVLDTLSNLKIGPSSRSWKSVSLWLLKNVFWLAIYLLGSYLTIWLCLILLNEYRSAPVLTHATANMAKTVPLPNITVCVPFNATLMFPSTSSSSTPYSNSIQDFFSKTIRNGAFDTTNYIKEWNNSREMISNDMLFILHKYLTIMYEAENLRGGMKDPFASLHREAESDPKHALLNILMPQIQQMNIQIDEIKNIFIEYFKIGKTDFGGVIDDGVFFCINRHSYDQCDFFHTISYLDQNQACFKMPITTLQADDENLNHVIIYINDHSQAIKMSDRKIIFNFNGDATPPNFAAKADESSTIELIIGDITEIYIDYESVYRTLPQMSNGNLSCSDQTRRECEENCRIGLIKAMCGCTPVTFTTGQSDENKCTFVHYEKCLTYLGNEDEGCRTRCSVGCEQSNYKLSKPFTYNIDIRPAITFTIYLNKYDYFFCEEYFKWTVSDFISAIGGALGIWLGIDFIVLIRFITTPLVKVAAKALLKVSSLAKQEAATIEDNQPNLSESVIKKVLTALNIEVPPQFTRVSLVLWSIGKFLWAVIYIAGGVFTAISCKELYEQYRDSGLKTSMHVSFNKSISLPPATLCLYDNMKYYNINPNVAPSTNYTDALRDYLNQTNISKETILQYGNNGSSWPHVMVYIVYKYLSVLYYYEYYNARYAFESDSLDKNKYPIKEWQEQLSDGLYQQSSWADEYCYTAHTASYPYYYSTIPYTERPYVQRYHKCIVDIKAAHNQDCANSIEYVLIPKLTEFNITLEELRQKTLYRLNSDAQLTLRFIGSNGSTIINNLRAAALGYQTYCMLIPLDNFEFTSEKDYAEIAIESDKILGERLPYQIILKFDTTFDYLTTHHRQFEDEIIEQTKVVSFYRLPFGRSKSFSLRVNYKMALEPNPEKCASVKSSEEWEILHRIQYIEELCNCSPTNWPELLSSTSVMCTLQDYKTCLIFNESSWFYNKTLWSNTSGLPCEKIKVDIIGYEISDDETSRTNTSVSRIRFRVEDFVYLTIKEEMEMTFVDFAVAFGGMLGIVLGLDFRFIAWLMFMPPFVLISQLFKKLLYKKAFFLKPLKNTKLKTMLNAKFVRVIANSLDFDISEILKLNKFVFIKKLFENAYWLFYYTAGGILTFLLFISVITDYVRNNDAKVKFKPMNSYNNDESILLPSPTICLPIFPLKIDSDHGQSNITSTSFVQNYLSNKTKMDLLEDEWDHAFINYVHSYIVQYGKYEWFSYDDFPKKMDHSAFFDILDNMINEFDITFEQLREKFGRELAKMYQLNVAFYTNTSNETTESLNSHIVFVEESKICFKPLMELLTFNSVENFVKITVNGELMRQSDDYFAQLAPITFDLIGRNTSKKGATLLDATVSSNFGQNTTVALEIGTIVKAQPVVGGEKRCSQFLSLAQCRSSCVARTIQNTCKCLPRTITLTTPADKNDQLCTLVDYKQCNFTLHSDVYACLDGCLEPCERIKFSTYTSITNTTLKSISLVEVNLRIGSFKYQYMEEQLIYTREEFIGEIGGALGLFLGLNVLMFIEFFCALFVRLFDICVTKKWANVQPLPDLNDEIDETSL